MAFYAAYLTWWQGLAIEIGGGGVLGFVIYQLLTARSRSKRNPPGAAGGTLSAGGADTQALIRTDQAQPPTSAEAHQPPRSE